MKIIQRFFADVKMNSMIGGVNQGFAGIQEKFGKYRITDTGIRESSIIGY